MSGFVVDARSLLAVRDALGRLHEQLLTMHTVIYGFWGALGGHELEGELEHFCGTWHWGVTEIAGQVAGLMAGLTAAAAAYERIERRLAGESGSGTTVIGGGPVRGGSGAGTTVIGGGGPVGGGSGSGTTVIGGGGTVRGGSGSGTTVIGGTG